MDKTLWAKRIADKLHVAEGGMDQTIAALMDVVTEVQAAQRDLNVSAVSTDSSLSKFMEALTALQQARSSTVGGHRRIEKLGEALGIRTTAIGSTPGKTLIADEEEPSLEQARRAVG